MIGLGETRRFELVPLLAERFFLIYYLFIAGIFLYHNDLGWHLAAGDYIRQHGVIPKTDPWSYTAGTQPWINFSWGWDVIASYLHERFGMLALQVITACAGAAIIGIQASLTVRMGAALVPSLLALFIGGIALPQFSPPDVFLAVAPQVVTLLLAVIFNFILWYALEKNVIRLVLVLPLLMLLWANMHGGFVLGFILMGAYLFDMMRRSCWHQMRTMICAMVACFITSTMTPWGVQAYSLIYEFMQHLSKPNISEWQSVWQRFEGKADLMAVAYLILFVPALLGMLRARRVPVPLLLICLFLYIKAWLQIRYISVFIVLSMPLMAWGLSNLVHQPLRMASVKIQSSLRYVIMATTILLVAVMLFFQIDRTADLPEVRWPKEEIGFIETHYQDRRLINHWNYGSFIIYQSRGVLKPFIDGRAETAYPLSVFENYFLLYPEGDWATVLKNYNIGVVLWPKIDRKMQAFFRSNPDWKMVYEGRLAFVYAKQ